MTALMVDAPEGAVIRWVTREAELRAWLNEEVWVPYDRRGRLEESSWPDGRMVTRWIAHGYGSVNDAVETYRKHDRIAV